MDTQTYEGSCHCGAVRYQVTMAPPDKGMACNCSICSRAGWLLAFVPASAFELVSGQEALRDYQFGKKHLHHFFCSTCGVRGFTRGADGKGNEMVGVNLRCIPAIDTTKLAVDTFDGAKV
jgi:hypothetical protein